MNLKTDIFGPYSTCVIGDLPDKLKPVVGVVYPHIHHPPPKITDIYFAKYYGRGGGMDGWLGEKMKTDMWGKKWKRRN